MSQSWFDAHKPPSAPEKPAPAPGKKPLNWFELHQPNRVEMRPEEQQLVETDWFAQVAGKKPGQIPIPSVDVGDGTTGLPQGPAPMGRAARPTLADAVPPPTTSEGAAEFGKNLAITSANALLSIPETLIGLQNLSTFGLAGKAYDSVGLKPTDWKNYLSQFYSEGHKAKLQNIADAKGMIDTAIRVLQNFAVVGHAVVESLPSMWVGGKVGQGILWGANKLAARQGGVAATRAGNKILEMLTGKYGGAIAGGLGEGVVTAGQSAESIRAQTPDRSLSTSQAALAAGSGALTGFIGALGGSMAERLGFDDINTMLAAGYANRVARKNLARGLILGMIQEGPEEFAQSYQEQMANNLALGKDPWEGVDEAAVLGFFSGVVMSGGAQLTGAARNDLRFRGQVKGVTGALETAMEQPLTDTRPRLVEKARVAPSDRALKRGIDPITRALEETLTAPTPEGKPTLVRPEWSRNQDIEADADTRVATAAAFEELLRRGQLAPLVANDPSLLKAAKLAASGYKGLPVQIGSLPNGAVLLENDGTADQTDWTIVRENTPTGPTVMAYDEKGTILELGVNGQAGKDLAGVLQDIVAGKSRVDRPAPPSAPPGAPPAAPAAPGAPIPPTAAQPVEPAPVTPAVEPVAAPAEPAAAAPGAPVQVKPMTEAEYLQQLEAAMSGKPTPPAEPPAAAPPVTPPVTPPGPAPAAPAGGVPTMITRTMRLQLKKLGHTDEAINAMTPEAAWQLLEAEKAKAPPAPPAEAPAAPAAPTTPVDPAEAARNALAQALLDAAANLTGKPIDQGKPPEPPPAAPPAPEPPGPPPSTPPKPAPAAPGAPAAPAAPPAAKPFKRGDAVLHADGRRGLVTQVSKLDLPGEYSVDVSWDDGSKTGKLVGGIHGMPENWTKIDEAAAQPPAAPAEEEPREPTQLPAGKTRVSAQDDRAVEKARARRQRREQVRQERARKDADVDEAAILKADNNRRFKEVLAFARSNGYAGDEAALRAKFDVLIELGRAAVEDYAENQLENNEGRNLMRAIAKFGGIGYDPKHEERGEVDALWSLADPSYGLVDSGKTWTKTGKVRTAQPRKLPKARILGVWGVLRNGFAKGPEAFRKWGLSPDHMATSLMNDGWTDIVDSNALFEAMTAAVIDAKKQARGGDKGADDPVAAAGMKEVGWWDYDFDKDGRRLIADPVLEPAPTTDWRKASDDELRAMYDLVKDLRPDSSWLEQDVAEHQNFIAEAKRRGLVPDEPPPPDDAPADDEDPRDAAVRRLESLPIEQVVAEANALIGKIASPHNTYQQREKLLDEMEAYDAFLDGRDDVSLGDDERFVVDKPDVRIPDEVLPPEEKPKPAPKQVGKPRKPPTRNELALRPLDEVMDEANLLVDQFYDARIVNPDIDADDAVPLLLHYEVFLHTVPTVKQDEEGHWGLKDPEAAIEEGEVNPFGQRLTLDQETMLTKMVLALDKVEGKLAPPQFSRAQFIFSGNKARIEAVIEVIKVMLGKSHIPAETLPKYPQMKVLTIGAKRITAAEVADMILANADAQIEADNEAAPPNPPPKALPPHKKDAQFDIKLALADQRDKLSAAGKRSIAAQKALDSYEATHPRKREPGSVFSEVYDEFEHGRLRDRIYSASVAFRAAEKEIERLEKLLKDGLDPALVKLREAFQAGDKKLLEQLRKHELRPDKGRVEGEDGISRPAGSGLSFGQAIAAINAIEAGKDPKWRAALEALATQDSKVNDAWEEERAKYGEPPATAPDLAELERRSLDDVIREANAARYASQSAFRRTGKSDGRLADIDHTYVNFLDRRPGVKSIVDRNQLYVWVRDGGENQAPAPTTNPAKKPTAAKKAAEAKAGERIAVRKVPLSGQFGVYVNDQLAKGGFVSKADAERHAATLREELQKQPQFDMPPLVQTFNRGDRVQYLNTKSQGEVLTSGPYGVRVHWLTGPLVGQQGKNGYWDAPAADLRLLVPTKQPSLGAEMEQLAEDLKKQPKLDSPFNLSPEAKKKVDKIQLEREQLFKELGKKASEAQTGFDPAIAKLSFQLLKTYTDEGFVRFADVVQKLIDKLGPKITEMYAAYWENGWRVLTGQPANTLETMKALNKDAKKAEEDAKKEPTQKEKLEGYTGPVTASALLTGENVQLLHLHGLDAKGLTDGDILLTGRTYDFQAIFQESGGKQATHFGITYYQLPPDGLRRVLIHLAGLPRPRRRPAAPDAHYLGSPRFAKLRADADGRPDESGVDGDSREGLLPDTRALLEKGLAKGIPQHIINEQIEDAVRIIQAWDKERKLFLLASDPGSGKTYVLGAVMKELLHRGVENITYVTKSQDLIAQITKRDLKAFGLGKVNFITYQGMLDLPPEATDVFILDESHSAKNVADQKKTAVLAGQWMEKSAFPILASATPFENPVQAAYLAASGIFEEEFQGWESFAFAFGASPQVIRQKDGKGKTKTELLPVWKTTKTNEEDAAASRTWFLKKGVYTSRRIRLPEGMVDSRLVQIEVPDDEALTFAAMADAAAENEDNIKGWQAKAWRVNFFKRLLEASKITTAIKEADAAMKRGRFPVIFIETKAARQYNIPDLIRREEAFKEAQAAGLKPKRRDKPYELPPRGIVEMFQTFMESTGRTEINIPPATQLIRDYFGHHRTMIYTGEVSKLKASSNLEAWRNAKTPAVLVATMAKGGTGLSLHDEEGGHPTTQINVNLPWTGTQVLQVTQRTARYGLQSKAEIQWLFASNIFFDQVLARRVGKRMADLGASVHGRPPGEAGKIENWDLEDVPFSEINKLNRLQGKDDPSVGDITTGQVDDDEDTTDEASDEELASTTSEVGDRRRGVAAEGEVLGSAPQGKRGSVEPPAGAFGIPGKAPTGEQLIRIPLPEAVELAQELSKSLGKDQPPIIRLKLGKNLGQFRTGPGDRFGVEIRSDLFKPGKERELAAVLLHEIGHFTDFVPDKTVKRGRILGHILTLQQFMAQSFTRPDGTVVREAEVLKELKKLSLLWRPWDRATAPKSFIEYRDSAVELYADALSALFNSPGLVQKTAPVFYNEFFEYLDRKPDAKAAYFDLQARLLRIEDVLERYQRRATQMFDVGNTRAIDLQKMRLEKAKLTRQSIWMQLRAYLVDRDVPFQDRVRELIKRGQVVLAEKNPVFKAEERRQVAAKQKRWIEMFVQPMYEGIKKLGIRHSEFGKKVFFERILAGDRGDKGNPRGTDPERAQLALDDLHRIWGPQKTAEVNMLLEHFRDGMMEVFEEAYHRGELYTPKQWEKYQENRNYATFWVLDHLASSMSAQMYHQIGTFKDILNPVDATVAKMLVTIRATEDMETRRSMADFLLTNFPEDIEEATAHYDMRLGARVPDRPTAEARDRGHSELVLVKRQGKTVGYWVDPWIAKSWNEWSIDRRNMFLQVLRLANGKVFRPLFITYNVGFQAYNLMRDFYRFWKNIPAMSLGRAFKRYYQALPIAKVRAFGMSKNPKAWELAAQEFIHQSEKAALLGITYNELHDNKTLSDENLENIMSRAHVPGYGPIPRRPLLLKPFLAALEAIKQTGDFIETLPKAAGIIEYAGRGSIADIPPDVRSFIRRKVGSPDFTTASLYKAVTNEVFLFSNAIIQAVRSDIEVMTDPKTASGYWFKTVAVNIIPKMLMAAAAMGLLGEALRRMMAGVSEYKKTNYITIPLGEDAQGNVTTLQIPQDDMGRLIGGLLWKGLGIVRGRTDVIQTLQALADYSAGQLPSVTPVFGAAADVATYAVGANPYDPFRGRNVLTDQEQAARGVPALKKFVGYEFQQLGGNIIYKWYNNEPYPKATTWGQRLINLPLTGNLVGRFVTIGQSGRAEEARMASRGAARTEAQKGLEERDLVYDTLRSRLDRGQRQPDGDTTDAMARNLARQLYPGDRAMQLDRTDNIKRRLQMGFKRGGADAFADAVLNAPSVAQKVAVLQEVQRQKGIAAFPTWLRQARQSGVVSDATYKAYMAGRTSSR